MLKKNVGNADRAFRILLGIGLISLVFFGPKTPWGWIGVIPLFTALFGTCPLYSLMGLNTCPKK
jgi:ABC-type polysaccharide/polyol phosphate export permease